MKKTLFPIVLVSALMTIISCNKSFDAQEEGLVASSETKTFTATIESDDTKTTLTSERKVNWESGDKIAIIDNSGEGNGGVYTATPKDDDATKATFEFASGTPASTHNYIAYYPAKICWDEDAKTTPTLPATQTCDGTFALSPMYASSESTSLSFKNICSVIKLKTNFAVSSIELSSDKNLSGPFTIDDANDYAMSMSGTDDANKKVKLNVANDYTPTADNEGYYYYYIAIPAQQYSTLTIKVTAGGNTKTMTKTMPSYSLVRNTIYNLTFIADFVALTGEFSVGGGKKVKFSPGNLYYDGRALHFEAYQWTTQTKWSTSHVSHFYWTDDIAKSASKDYSESEDPYTFFADENNKQTVDGETGWYALSIYEWDYLINTRKINGATESGYGETCIWKNVNGIDGLVIFPDNYTGTSGADWLDMEAAGCVFLPAAGCRDRSTVDVVGSCGHYWSSTPEGTNSAYYLYLYSGSAFVNDDLRDCGFSVRLVRE